MKWRPGQRSSSIENRRGDPGGGGGLGPTGGGGGLPIPMNMGKRGCGGLVVTLLIVLAVAFLGGRSVLDGGGGSGGGFGVPDGLDPLPKAPGAPTGQAPTSKEPVPGSPDPDKRQVEFVSFVTDDVQTTWAKQFEAAGKNYQPTRVVLFSGSTQSGCGPASSDTGPFYCPLDQKVYIDLGFFRELRDRFGAPGDFAQAYVIAHEIGHHVQTLTGISEQVQQEVRNDPSKRNALSIRTELQADCLAGVWAHSTYERGLLEPGDLEEGLGAAAAVGDDRIQESTTGSINPETWTHGSSEQRTHWFKVGFDSGNPDDCDTFAVSDI